jgi:hypothetical protein
MKSENTGKCGDKFYENMTILWDRLGAVIFYRNIVNGIPKTVALSIFKIPF